jgi:hypothetical protein
MVFFLVNQFRPLVWASLTTTSDKKSQGEQLTSGCIHPETLAQQKGWQVIEWADTRYGGLRVGLAKADQLPPKWEAIGEGQTIKQDDVDRHMNPGVWSIYTPFYCRAQFGFSR